MPRGEGPEDPRGLIGEAYRIEGISAQDCRTIFFDWALDVPDEVDPRDLLQVLHDRFANRFPEHPMTAVLAEGLQDRPSRRRPRRQK